MRLFVGIAAAGDLLLELTALVDKLRPRAPGLRWSKPESWHVTLQFLGNADEEQLERLKARLEEVRAAPVPVRLDGLGVFKGPGIFYVEVEPTAALVALQKRVVAATAQCGFVAEERAYRPHFTLARAKNEAGRRELKKLNEQISGSASQRASESADGRISAAHHAVSIAREFVLYESHAEAGGSRYEARARFAMGGLAG